MIDASQIPEFGYFWVFWGGLSDVEYHITVTDTVSQQTWERTNAPGNICGGFDLQAFEP
jgi:hypothetical protein